LDGLTRSSNGRARNDAARGSVLLALLALAIPVAAYAAARELAHVSLVQATAATCASAVLGGLAVLLARRGLRKVERTLGRAGGEGAARVGRLLGVIGLCVGLTAAIALGVFAVLNLFGR
jgi:membrane protein implicated in regulation of membrane protease activity